MIFDLLLTIMITCILVILISAVSAYSFFAIGPVTVIKMIISQVSTLFGVNTLLNFAKRLTEIGITLTKEIEKTIMKF